jgi:AcrR family transcriptional regulator
MRDIAEHAGVSATLLYRYFPSKRSVVLALYDELSAEYATRVEAMSAGKWRTRFVFALSTSLDVIGPHREALKALIPVLVSDDEGGLFSSTTSDSRTRVQSAFATAVVGASGAPAPKLAEALGRLLYLAHLGVILWWLLDKSPAQRATKALVSLLGQALAPLSLGVRLPPLRGLVLSADALLTDAILTDHGPARSAR